MTTRIYNFVEVSANFELKPEKAIEFFQSKGLRESFDWLDMVGEEHDVAFTVAKMMDTDLLLTVQHKLTRALEQGTTLGEFARSLIPELQKAGWWGKQDIVDPVTGLVTKPQLGSASRLETIFRTNLQSAYSVGRWDMIKRNAKAAPYLMYDAVDDHRTRPEHRKYDQTVLPVTNAFWDDFYPPNGWNCRCGVIQLSQDELKDFGLTVSRPPKVKRRSWTNPRTGAHRNLPEDLDPGWDHNPGKRRLANLKNVAAEKKKLLTEEQVASLSRTPAPELPTHILKTDLTLDEAKQYGGDRLSGILETRVEAGPFAGRTRSEALQELVERPDDPRVEEWAQEFQDTLLQQLAAVRAIRTPAKVEGRGKGAKAVADASKRYPDDWTAAADRVGPLYVKYSSKRGWQATIDRDVSRIPEFGLASKKFGEPGARWKKGSGFIVTDDSSTAAHEYAHRLQYALAELDAYFNEEHFQRTKGDPLRRLRELTGLPYPSHERARKDGYYHPYMGKEYEHAPAGRPAMEVMTMAFEPLLGNQDPRNGARLRDLLSKDPEMARLAIGLLFHFKAPE